MDKKHTKSQKTKNRKAVLIQRSGILLIVIFFFVMSIRYIWQQIYVQNLAREVNDLQHAIEQVVNNNKAFKVEIAALSGLNRIEKIAKEKLGMQYPDKFPVVLKLQVLESDSSAWQTAALYRFESIVAGVKKIFIPTVKTHSCSRN